MAMIMSVLLIIRSVKTAAFVDALEQLVSSETKGEYILVVGDATLQISNLNFVLEDVVLSRADTVKQKGIKNVTLPRIHADLGSLKSFFSIGQIHIQSIVIDEPYISINTGERRDSIGNITEQIQTISKAIETVLNQFDVAKFSINRAAVNVLRPEKGIFKISLISLFVSDWNMRQMRSTAEVGVTIGGQHLLIGDVSFNFSSIEYRYPQHHLIFYDFDFFREDSILHTRLKGKAIRIMGLDYEELYYNSNYNLRRIEIDEPALTTIVKGNRVSSKKGHLAGIYPEFMRLFGRLNLDSVLINDGQVDLRLENKQHVAEIKIQHYDFSVSGISIDKDSASTGFVKVQLFVEGVSAQFDSVRKLTCDAIDFVNNDSLLIRNLNYQDGKSYSAIGIPSIRINNPKIPTTLENKSTSSGLITIENPSIKLRKLTKRKEDGESKSRILDDMHFAIKGINIVNGAVEYSDNGMDIKLGETSLYIGDIQIPQSGEMTFALEKINVADLRMKGKEGLSIQSRNIGIKDHEVYIQDLEAIHGDLDIIASKVTIRKDSIFQLRAMPAEVDRIAIGNVRVSGKVPLTNKGDDINHPYKVGAIEIDNIKLDVRQGLRTIKFSGQDFLFDSINTINPNLIGSASGRILNLHMDEPHKSLDVQSLNFNTSSSTTGENISVNHKETSLKLKSFQISPLTWGDGFRFAKGSVQGIKVEKVHVINSSIDSVQFSHFDLVKGTKPHIAKLSVFHPVVEISKSDGESKKAPNVNFVIEDFIDEFSLVNGEVDLKNRKLTFHSLSGAFNHNSKSLVGSTFKYHTPTTDITLGQIDLSKSDLTLRELTITPKESVVSKYKTQFDLIKTNIGVVNVTGVDFDKLVKGHTGFDSVRLNQIQLDIFKDKRLPLPPPIEKPFLLSSLIPKGVSFNYADIKNMYIHYHELSQKTGLEGSIELHDVEASIKFKINPASDFRVMDVRATTKLYNDGIIRLSYIGTQEDEFLLDVNVSNVNLVNLNKIVLPLQHVEIKKGVLHHMNLTAKANPEFADATTTMTYKKLNIIFRNQDDLERSNLGNDLMTLLANGIILKHSKVNAIGTVKQPRVKEKAVFNYWVKTTLHSGLAVVTRGKKSKNRK